ncbi:LuxR C-terminal-related transcriptional regulator [Xanthomarina spongicola]|uniref:LuxR C-terminal-related transcriptional regulator n=1 Tax=Xanthomarina spongicola TaxID=570520 RepID=UPI00248289CF|nr:LuxR C-terminal-related transcriptional regulator [Xanthomarina spongicola]
MNIPALPSDLIRRPHLLKKLERKSAVALILISAPAGYGKSILISQWIKETESAHAWLSIDETMNDTSIFLTYISEAISKFSSIEKQSLKNLDKDYNFINWPSIIEIFVNSLNVLDEHTVLILDNYHLIRNQEIHQLVQTLIDEEIKNLQVLIITRWDPPFKLQKLRIYDRIVELRMSNLKFEKDELIQFFTLHRNIKLTSDEVDKVIEDTEGWILAIRMLLLARSFRMEDYEIKGIENISNYLDQLLSYISLNLEPEFFKQMQLCALCDQFNVELIDSICDFAYEGSCKGEVFLAKLKELNFFIIATDLDGGWYRFHHLVGETLIRNLKKTDPDIAISIYTHISKWFFDKNFVDEAINFAIKAKNYDLACSQITKHRASILDQDQWWVLQRWLDKIPRQIRNANMDILVTELLVCEETWNIEDFSSILNRIESIGLENSNAENISRYLFHLGYFLTFVEPNPKKAVESLEQSIALFHDESALFGGRRDTILACSRQMLGETSLALKSLEDIHEKFERSSKLYVRSLDGKVLVHLLSGNFESANKDLKKFLFLVQDSDFLYLKGWSSYYQGNIAFQFFQKDRAMNTFKKALEFEGVFNYRVYFDALAGLVLMSSLQKDKEATALFLEKMSQMANKLKDTNFKNYYRSVQARVNWHKGMGEKEMSWVTTDRVKQHSSLYLFLIDVPELTKTRIMISHGSNIQVQEALSVLEEVEVMLESVYNHYQHIDIILLKAMGFFRLRKENLAAKWLAEALTLAEKKNMIRPIMEVAMVMPSLFSVLKDAATYRILTFIIFDVVPQKTRERNLSDVNELTLREQEIIRLIFKGLRNKEVAQQLNISILTVKTHLRNIYSKLDVSSRTAMINKILEKNLFTL